MNVARYTNVAKIIIAKCYGDLSSNPQKYENWNRQFQINKAIVKLSNVSAVPSAPIAELYRFVENIVENVDQNQHIITTSDLNFDMLQHSNLPK